jgi:mono/diheme cytochrome c family protein
MRRCLISLVLTCAFGAFAQTGAQESADANSGRIFAKEICAECHAVSEGQVASPTPAALSFKAISNTSGMPRIALIVWFQTPHPTMPNLMLKADDLDEVIAYILSLKDED